MIGLSVAIVDPGSLAGRDVRIVLRERGFPALHFHLFHSGEPESGLLTEDDGEAAFVAALPPDGLSGCQIAFLCGPPEATARFLARREPDGCLAIDLSGQRASGDFVDALRGVLPSPLPGGDLLVLRDPVATVLADTVAALETLRPVSAVTVAVDRPVSEMGKDALDELFQQAIAIASFRSVPKDHLGAQCAFNVFPPADADAFDARVSGDVRALLGHDLPLTLLSARAGVFHGTTFRLDVRFEGDAPPVGDLRSTLLAAGHGFAEPEVDADGPAGIIDAAGRDETLLLRAASSGSAARLFLASDDLRRPGALLAVRIAEACVAERGLLPDA
jgi:aspartate-semialdehyde dehydrogenase